MGDQPAAKSPEAVSPPSPSMLEGGRSLDDTVYRNFLHLFCGGKKHPFGGFEV